MGGGDRQAEHWLIRAAFGMLAGAAVVIGGALVLFPGHTAVYFAWTLKAPIAAVTLGGWFLGLAGFAGTLARGPLSALRLAAPAIALGSLLMLAATLIHRAAFNWHTPWAWIWLLLYLAAPPSFAVFTAHLSQTAGSQPSDRKSSGLPRAVPLGAAVIAGTAGTLLFLFPSAIAPVWPWPLVPLGARAYAAYPLGYALWAWRIARNPASAGGSLCFLSIFPAVACLAPWLQPSAFRALTPGGILFLLLSGGLALIAAHTVRIARKSRQPAS